MKNLVTIGAMAALSFSFFHMAGQARNAVRLVVIHNGRQRPAPAEIKVRFQGHSLRIPVRGGKFEAPAALIAASRVIFETDVEESHIRLTKITGADFTEGKWTLRLAEHFNEDYYDWPGPKDANIPASCILEFDSGRQDPARGLFEEHCRRKKK
jgi:hypothetical protein